jgi:uncharacterized protein YndB with AHSA1/START domain
MMSDSVQKQIHLEASIARVWQAITDPAEFQAWFGISLSGGFKAGTTIYCAVVDQPEWAGRQFPIEVVTVEPPHRLVVRWHPYPVEGIDLSTEPMTTCEFTLAEAGGGTDLTVVETGFDAIPEARRADAFRMNDAGWTQQMQNIRRYLEA